MKNSKCKRCGVDLPVPSWEYCMLHDGSKYTTTIKFKKRHEIKKFSSYYGYSLDIPFTDFLKAEELVVDQDKWTIIGWR